MLTIEQIKQKITPAITEFDIERIEVFGSYADGTATEKSDVDLLVKFAEDIPSLFDVCYLYEQLKEAMGINIDMVTLPVPSKSKLVIGKKVNIYEREG